MFQYIASSVRAFFVKVLVTYVTIYSLSLESIYIIKCFDSSPLIWPHDFPLCIIIIGSQNLHQFQIKVLIYSYSNIYISNTMM